MEPVWVLLGTAAVGVSFNVPRRALAAGALASLLGWALAGSLAAAGHSPLGTAFAGAFAVAALAEVLARLQRLPSTVYTVPGILPLVPGSRAYQATVALLAGDSAAAGGQAQAAFLAAGGIAAGVLLASALPRLLRSRALDRKAPPHYDGEVGRFQA